MSSKYIDNGSYATSGYTLSGVFQSITVGASGTIGGPGVIGGTIEAYTIVNRGRINGASAGIYLRDGGSVSNTTTSALVAGNDGVHVTGGAGSVENSGTIEGSGSLGVGVLLADGGVVSNGTYAVISGVYGIDVQKASATIINAGGIESTSRIGVELAAGGTVLNSGGIISDGSIGLLQHSGMVVNQGYIAAKGTTSYGVVLGNSNPTNGPIGTLINYGQIRGQIDGVIATNAVILNKPKVYGLGIIYGKENGAVLYNVTVVNDFQHFAGETGAGIVANGNCVIQNGSLGAIYGRMAGIEVTGRTTITNYGEIGGGSRVYTAENGSGIVASADIVLTNKSGVFGYDGMDLATDTFAVINNYNQIGGSIRAGIVLGSGTIYASNSSLIFGPVYGVEAFGGLTLTNSGLILTGTRGSPPPTAGYYADTGVYIHPGASEGVLTNGTSGEIYGLFGIVAESSISVVNAGIIGDALSDSPGPERSDRPAGASASAPFDGGGIVLGGPMMSSVTNASTGTITAGHGIAIFGPATIVNAGAILGTLSTGISVAAYATAGIDNLNSGTISGVSAGVAAAGATVSTVSNAGMIAASGTNGIGVEIGGFVLNEAGALIVGATGVSLIAGTVTNFGTIASLSGTSGVSISIQSTGGVLVDQAGSSFIGQVAGGGGTLDLAGNGGTLSSLGTSFSSFGAIDVITGANWRLSGSNTIAINALFTVETGGTLAISGTIAGRGTLVLGGTETIQVGTKMSVADVSVSGGDVSLTTNGTYAGNVQESAGAISLAAKHTLDLTGTVSFLGGAVDGAGFLATYRTVALTAYTVNAGAMWQVYGTVNAAGYTRLGNDSGGSGRLTVETGGVFDIIGAGGVAVAPGGSGTLANLGLFEKTGGGGVSVVEPGVINTGTLKVTAGTLDFVGAVTGGGSATIGAAATLDFGGAVASTQTICFAGSGARLLLADISAFQAAIKGFDGGGSSGDIIDVTSFGARTKVIFAQTVTGETVVTLTNGTDSAKLTLFGQYSLTGFGDTASSVGTVISYMPPAQIALASPHH